MEEAATFLTELAETEDINQYFPVSATPLYVVLIFRFLYFSTQSFKSGLLLFTVFVEGSVTSTPYILCVSPLCVYVSLHCVLCVLSVKVTMLLLRHTASMLQFPLLFAAVLKHLI